MISGLTVLAFPTLCEEAYYLTGCLAKPGTVVLIPPRRHYELYLHVPPDPGIQLAGYLRAMAVVLANDFSRSSLVAWIRHPWTRVPKTALLSVIQGLEVYAGLANWEAAFRRNLAWIGERASAQAEPFVQGLSLLGDWQRLLQATTWETFWDRLNSCVDHWGGVPKPCATAWVELGLQAQQASQDGLTFSAAQALSNWAKQVLPSALFSVQMGQGIVGHWGLKPRPAQSVVIGGMTSHDKESLALLRAWIKVGVPVTATYPVREGKHQNMPAIALSVLQDDMPVCFEDGPAITTAFSDFAGHDPILGSAPLTGERQYQRGQQKGFSPTRLERYSDCPRRYFYRDALGLAQLAKSPDAVSDALWGTLVHRILELFFTAQPFSDAYETFVAVAEQVVGDRQTFDWLLVRERLLGEGQLLRQLWALFQEESTGFRPWQSEMGLSVDLCDVRISGKVDAIWRNADTDALAVVDFKTGKSLPERREIDKFERIQLLLYCLAIGQRWPQNEVAGALYIHLPVHGEPKRKVVLATPSGKASLGAGRARPLEWNSERREALIAHVQTLVAGIRSGMFEAMPLPMRCRSCEFRLICRYPRRWESY